MRELFFLVFIYSAFGFSLNTTCEPSEYFDSSMMQCEPCGLNKVRSSSDLTTCTCKSGYAKTNATRDFPVFDCEACASGVSSSDHYTCQFCPQNAIITNNECECNSLNPSNNQVILEFSQNGDYLTTKQCFDCTFDFFDSSNLHNCVSCPNNMTRLATGSCGCSQSYTQSGNYCIDNTDASSILSNYAVASAVAVDYLFTETSQGLGTFALSSSSAFQYYYLKAGVDCQKGAVIGCQVLANLCVLQLYNKGSTVCTLYESITATRNYANPTVQDSG